MTGRKSLTIFLSQWGGNGVLMLTSIIVARVLGPAEVGRMAFFMGTLGLFFMFTSLGFFQAHQKRLAEGMDLGLCVGTLSTFQVTLSFISVGIAAAVWPLLSSLYSGADAGRVYAMVLAFLMITGVNQIFTNTFYGRQEFARAAVVLGASRGVRFLAVIVLLVRYRTLTALAACLLLEAVIGFVLGGWLSGAFRQWRRPTRASVASYWSYAKPLAINSPLNVAVENTDRVILGARFPSLELGCYNVAMNLFEALKSIPSAVVTALFPGLTEAMKTGGPDAAKEKFNNALRKLLLIATPVALAGTMAARDVIHVLYGAEFAPAGPVFAFFFLLFWFICLATPFHYVLYAGEKHRPFVWISPVANAIYGVALWVLCSPSLGLGALGAALAFAVPHVVSFPLVLFHSRRDCGIGFPASLRVHSVTVFILLVLANVAAAALDSTALRAATAVLLLGAYAAAVFVSGQLKAEDIHYVRETFHLGRFFRHLMAEFTGKRN